VPSARATSAAPTYFEPYYKKETNESYVDGAVFYNNPVTVALQESHAIWQDDAEFPPDILLSLGTGHAHERRAEEFSSPEKETLMHRHFCAPLANLVFGDPKYVQRWLWEDNTIFRSVSILRHRAGSVINAQQQWTQFQTSVLGAQARDEGRYCRLSPQPEGKIPRLDEYSQMGTLQTKVKQLLRSDPTFKEQIAQIAHRLIASCFYFDGAEEIPDDYGCFRARGKYHISSRMAGYIREVFSFRVLSDMNVHIINF
jgi:hypothetical protein